MLLLLITLIADLSGLSDEVEVVIDVAGLVTLVPIPFAFLGGLLRSRLSRAGAVSELVARLTERDDRRSGLRDALADALGDPGLSLLYWLPARERYVNAEGQPVELPAPFGDRVATVVEDHGTPVAAIVHDASLHDERDLIAAVGAAATLTLENERLDAELRAKVEELRDQRRRGVEAALDERRRLERNLHDGAQQRLVAMALKLRMARARVAETTRRRSSCSRRRRPSSTRRSRSCASWRAASTRRCSATAGSTPRSRRSPTARRSRWSWRPHPACGCPRRWRRRPTSLWPRRSRTWPSTRPATRATVRAVRDNGHVVVEVTDDGVGGADPSKGSGLEGLADRLCSLDGRLEVMDARGGGTIVRADIPC